MPESFGDSAAVQYPEVSTSGRRGEPILITDVPLSYDEQLAARKKRYVLMMLMRVPCLLAAAACYQIPWLAVTFIAMSVPLPWMAVLVANDAPAKKKRMKKVVPGTISYERAIEPKYEVVDALDSADSADAADRRH